MSDSMTRLNAALEGRYRIQRELGEGGMATVYLADDLRHERKVALKVLKPELAAVVGAERFLAEIKTTANLQHPHILPLFDSGEADGFLFYVMPYVEGESLRERIDRERQLPVDEALGIATAVAGALQAAHEQGVIHRDIKPGNILLSRGQPLVADFGVALAVSAGGRGRLTETGLSLGTPYYMSPEQATGDQVVGPASDTFALACVLYEMLVGDPPYPGSTAQAVLGKIIQGLPVSATTVRQSVPANVDAAIRKALEKLPADRFRGAQDFARALADAGFRHGTAAETVTSTAPARWNRLTTAFATTTVLLAVALAVIWLRPLPEPGHATRSLIDLDRIELATPADVLISPDGSRFALAGVVDGVPSLYWREAAEERFRVIPGTEDALWGAAFSPDGNWVAYTTRDGVFKVSLSGGAPTRVASTGDVLPILLHWGDDGTIVFGGFGGTYRVPDTGGEPVLVGEVGMDFFSPSLLPGGGAVLGARRRGGIVLFDLEADSIRELIPSGTDPKYVETGHLLYADAAGGLWAAAFDASRGEVLEEAVPVLDGITTLIGLYARYSVSRNGTLIYGAGGRVGALSQLHNLLVVDLDGNEEPAPLEPRRLRDPRWSPDGETVVYWGKEPGVTGQFEEDIYTYNVELKTAPRGLTFEGDNESPVWSPDGTRVVFSSRRDGSDNHDLFVKTVNDDSPPRMILTLPGRQAPTQWVADNLLLIETGNGPSDLWLVDPSSDSTVASPYLEAEANLRDAVVAPNGTLAAYVSSESGTDEVYVRGFPEARQPEVVSQGGGEYPRWSPDGGTLYYWTPGLPSARLNRSLVAARVERGPPFIVLSRDTVLAGIYQSGSWDLHPDGDRMIVTRDITARDQAADATLESERFVIVVNWFEELRQRMDGN